MHLSGGAAVQPCHCEERSDVAIRIPCRQGHCGALHRKDADPSTRLRLAQDNIGSR